MINLNQNTNNLAVSIVPTFYCLTGCKYCYLQELRDDETCIAVNIIDSRLRQITQHGYAISSISIYGGEVSLLPEQYIDCLLMLAKQYCSNVGVATNGQNVKIFDLCKKHDVGIMISLNQERPDYKRNLKLIKRISNCTVGVVVLPHILNQTPKQFCDLFDSLQRDVYLFQYYQSCLTNDIKFSNKQYIDWVVKLLEFYYKTSPHNFKIINENEWKDNNYNPDESGFVYIMPNGKFATTSYTNCIEQYRYFDTIVQWEQYCDEQQLIRKIKCCTCCYFDRCKAEHVVVYNDPYCSGLKQIIQFYENAPTYKSAD